MTPPTFNLPTLPRGVPGPKVALDKMLLTKSIPILSVAELRFKLGMWLPLIYSGELRVAEVENWDLSASLPSHNWNMDTFWSRWHQKWKPWGRGHSSVVKVHTVQVWTPEFRSAEPRLSYMYECFAHCMSTCMVPGGVRRGCQIPRNLSSQQLWAAILVQGVKPGSSTRTVSAPNCRTPSLAPPVLN